MTSETSAAKRRAGAWLVLSVCTGVIGCGTTNITEIVVVGDEGGQDAGDGSVAQGTGDGSTAQGPDGSVVQGDTDGSLGSSDGSMVQEGTDATLAGQDGSVPPSADGGTADGGTVVPPGDGGRGADGAGTGDAGPAPGMEGGSTEAGHATDGGAGTDAGAGGPEQCVNRAPVASKWTLKWSDEFDMDGAPNPSNWGYESGFVRNEELQWYQPNNATVSGGLLTIAAQKQQVTNPNYVAGSSSWKTNRQYAQYTSTSMTTSGKQSFEYGRFEMCGQIDTRQGSWPAFWSLGDGKSWPASGEVDIMEYYAGDIRANVCTPSGSTCNWNGSVANPISNFASTWSSQFHLWAMEWDATDISLYLDDKLVWTFKVTSITSANPYTGNKFYILVNQAIGANGGDPSGTTFPINYKVDYVRVYQ